MGSGERDERAVREARARYAAAGDEAPKRKNHFMRQSKLDLAKAILGARTETEALDVALDMVIYGDALAVGTESVAGDSYVDVLGLGGEVPE